MKLEEIQKVANYFNLTVLVMPDYKGHIFVNIVRQEENNVCAFIKELKKYYKVQKNLKKVDVDTVSGMLKVKILPNKYLVSSYNTLANKNIPGSVVCLTRDEIFTTYKNICESDIPKTKLKSSIVLNKDSFSNAINYIIITKVG